jgi:hypothetical protein
MQRQIVSAIRAIGAWAFLLIALGHLALNTPVHAAMDFEDLGQPSVKSKTKTNWQPYPTRIRTAELIRDAKTGVIFDFPGGLRPRGRSYGTNWSGYDGKVQIDTLKYTGRECLSDTYESVRGGKSGAIAVDQVGHSEWLLAGREDSEAWWVKMVYRAGECRGLSVVISQELLSTSSIDLMRQIAESFEAFPGR